MREITIYAILMYIAVFGVGLYSAYTDVKERKIKNIVTFPLILIGIILNYFENGITGVYASLIGIAIMFILFILPCVFKQMGYGDIKLLMGIASVMGTYYTIGVILTGSFLGAFYAMYLWAQTKSKRINIPYGLFIFIGMVVYQMMYFLV